MGQLRAELAAIAASSIILAPTALAAPPGTRALSRPTSPRRRPRSTPAVAPTARRAPWSCGAAGSATPATSGTTSTLEPAGHDRMGGPLPQPQHPQRRVRVEVICAAEPKHYTKTFALAADRRARRRPPPPPARRRPWSWAAALSRPRTTAGSSCCAPIPARSARKAAFVGASAKPSNGLELTTSPTPRLMPVSPIREISGYQQVLEEAL